MTGRLTNRERFGLPPLVAPTVYRRKFSRWIPEYLRRDRDEWCAEQGMIGYTCADIGFALGISAPNAYQAMLRGGWNSGLTGVKR